MIQIIYPRNFVKSLGLDVNVVEWDRTLGNYNRSTDTISLNMKRITQNHRRGKRTYPFAKHLTEYIKLIVCHELGHRDDCGDHMSITEAFRQIDEEHEMVCYLDEDFCKKITDKVLDICVEKEVAAWELGRKYVPIGSEVNYDLLNQDYIDERRFNSKKNIESIIESKKELVRIKQEIASLTIQREGLIME